MKVVFLPEEVLVTHKKNKLNQLGCKDKIKFECYLHKTLVGWFI